jgi:hypothetical protein
MQHAPTIVRAATAADSAQLWRLAHVNGTRRLRGTVLVAERGGAVIGAIELKTGTVIGDQPYSDNEDTRLLQAGATWMRSGPTSRSSETFRTSRGSSRRAA